MNVQAYDFLFDEEEQSKHLKVLHSKFKVGVNHSVAARKMNASCGHEKGIQTAGDAMKFALVWEVNALRVYHQWHQYNTSNYMRFLVEKASTGKSKSSQIKSQ